jgi:hypothetical protein
MRLLARLRTDTEASTLPTGQSLLKLLRHELAELELLRADLLTLRSELVAYNRPWEASQPDPEFTVQKLKAVLQRIRARREGRLRPQRESTTALLLQNRAASGTRSRLGAAAGEAPGVTLQAGYSGSPDGPDAV